MSSEWEERGDGAGAGRQQKCLSLPKILFRRDVGRRVCMGYSVRNIKKRYRNGYLFGKPNLSCRGLSGGDPEVQVVEQCCGCKLIVKQKLAVSIAIEYGTDVTAEDCKTDCSDPVSV